jgi:hypothetical protein
MEIHVFLPGQWKMIGTYLEPDESNLSPYPISLRLTYIKVFLVVPFFWLSHKNPIFIPFLPYACDIPCPPHPL